MDDDDWEIHYIWPLHWPSSVPRTDDRRRATYRFSFERAYEAVLYELAHLDTIHIVVTSNVPDDDPDMGEDELEDPGVAVFYTLSDRTRHVLACDRWDLPKDNMRSIAVSLEMERRKARAGSARASVSHVRALPSNEKRPDLWRVILAVKQDLPTLAELKKAYRQKVMQAHPDRGGSNEEMHVITEAYEYACKELNFRP